MRLQLWCKIAALCLLLVVSSVVGLVPSAHAATTDKIVFYRFETTNYQIFIMDSDGTNEQQLTSAGANSLNPTLSPDATKIAFERSSRIFVMNVDGTGVTQVPNTIGGAYVSWSPDGTKLAFSAFDDDFFYQIFTINLDGTSKTQITSGFDDHYDAVWSPDGTKFAYSNNFTVYSSNTDGTGETALASTGTYNAYPVWSHDGTQIAFTSIRDGDPGNSEIYKMNANGSSQTRLTNSSTADATPTWSPDDTQIAFISDRDGNYEIYKMNADGTNQTRMTNNADVDASPDWGGVAPVPDPDPDPDPTPDPDPEPTPDSQPADTGGSSSGGGQSHTTTSSGGSSHESETQPGELVVNIDDGQIITGKYEVVVAPTPGTTVDYDDAQFYVDNTLQSTAQPDANGISRWTWDTAAVPGEELRVTAYADGQPIFTLVRTVVIRTVPTGPVASPTTPTPTVAATDGSFWNGLRDWLLSIPASVALAIPYVLFLLLAVLVAMLVYQARREALAAKQAKAAFIRAQQLVEAKDGFISLVSHYLRTPLTLIMGGAEMVSAAEASGLANAVKLFGSTIESLLGRVEQNPGLRSIVTLENSQVPKASTSPWFWVPLLLIVPTVVIFNAAFMLAGTYGPDWVNLVAQTLLMVILAVGLYMTVRWLLLSKRDHRTASRQAEQQMALDNARSQLIRDSAATLTSQLASIQAFLPRLQANPSVGILRDGCARIAEILDRFRAIATVAPVEPAAPYETTSLKSIFETAVRHSADAAKQKNVVVNVGTDMVFGSQKPGWVAGVVSSLVDNAVEYSPAGAQVAVSADVTSDKLTITVQDHGQGVPQDKLSALFQPFSKVEDPLEFDHPGIGLSLYTDRLLAAGMGGQVQMSPTAGGGTTVTLSLPLPVV